MSGFDIEALRRACAGGPVVRVLVARHRGSVPREAGTAMLVTPTGQHGTIGGGTLEFEAVAQARRMLKGGRATAMRAVPLGPALGQCCGGHVDLVFERFTRDTLPAEPSGAVFARALDGAAQMPFHVARAVQALREGRGVPALQGDWIVERIAPAQTPLWLYGAGHVGRAVVRVFTGLPFAITWVDDAAARFPEDIPDHAAPLMAANPADAVGRAPLDAIHIVLTYSHALDLEICHRVLLRPHAHLGLIGSATKAARFAKRLRELGHAPATIARLNCPIGDKSLGKEPAQIAIGLASELLQLRNNVTQLTESRA